MEHLKFKKQELPIDKFREEIVRTICTNQVTIINAETGAGKTTRVPQSLLEDTDYQLVVTNPRVISTISVAKRVADEMETELGGDMVGYRTAKSRCDTKNTRCLFATDGLQLIRELTSSKRTLNKGIVLILDEVHEWNVNIETLVAWIRMHILEGSDVKVVLMSATADLDGLSKFFDGAPIINVPGRCFPIVGSPETGIYQLGASSLVHEIKNFTLSGKNTLVFLPGKPEITDILIELQKMNLQAVILPFHAELDYEEQQKVFQEYSLPKIILSTNVAQTSVTIPDIDAVVDSGLEKKKQLINNVETVVLGDISKADSKQRAGRAGRVQAGEYVLCNDTPYEKLDEYPKPEITCSLLDQITLRLAGARLDATKLCFYHQPEKSVLIEARETLVTIGALDENGKITRLGREINNFPIDVKSARMIKAALDRKCLGPVIRIAAIRNAQGGSLKRRPRKDDPTHYSSWDKLIDPHKPYMSDFIVELDLFFKALKIDIKLLNEKGISCRSFQQTNEIINQLYGVLKNMGYEVLEYNTNADDYEEVCKCIIAGMLNNVYKQQFGLFIRDISFRKVVKDSRTNIGLNALVTAEPMNIRYKEKFGNNYHTLELIKNVTIIKLHWLQELGIDARKYNLPIVSRKKVLN